jgi:hypothetical protein
MPVLCASLTCALTRVMVCCPVTCADDVEGAVNLDEYKGPVREYLTTEPVRREIKRYDQHRTGSDSVGWRLTARAPRPPP